MATKHKCKPRVVRHRDEIALVLEHCDPAHRAKYTQKVHQLEQQERDLAERAEPQFSLNRNGFAFFQKISVFEDDKRETRVRGEKTGLWSHYKIRVEF